MDRNGVFETEGMVIPTAEFKAVIPTVSGSVVTGPDLKVQYLFRA
jgi:hypothetical protein